MSSGRHLVGVSQGVDIVASRSERRDALDQRWSTFLETCGYLAVPLPNVAASVPDLLNALTPVGIVLTGGNDLAAVGGDAPERDEAERSMLTWALAHGVPTIGVCRGLQMMLHEYGTPLMRVSGHVGVRHRIFWQGQSVEVNSYHGWGSGAVPPDFEPIARSEDGCIEAARHRFKLLSGIMWHPERENPFADHDIAFFRATFGSVR